MSRVILLFLFIYSTYLQAHQLTLSIKDSKGQAVDQAIVFLENELTKNMPAANDIAVMDQVDRQFKPYILPVQTNSKVKFPNSDSIKHHVYSFSQAKTFELPLYKGSMADPLIFSRPGVVELGCNVHDWMQGYILVVDTPLFVQTDELGQAKLEAPAGQYALKLWHPGFKEKPHILQAEIRLEKDMTVNFVLNKEVTDTQSEYSIEDEFSDYD